MENHISEIFAKRIVGAFGPAGADWLSRLPQTLKYASDRWSIELSQPYQPLSYNYVAPAITRNGESIVLKAGVPHLQFSGEIDALNHFDGQGAVQLIDSDADAGLMLLERLNPGGAVEQLDDDESATSVFAQVSRRFRKPPPKDHTFPSVADWAKGFQRLRDQFDGSTGPLPEAAVDRAEQQMSELISSTSNPIVLHGDLHHWNILSAEREPWLAVDPKGVMGEPEYEVGSWLRNPFPNVLDWPNPKDITARRVDQLTEELGFDRYRVIGWAYSQAVLAGVWSYEDGLDDWNGELAVANMIAELRISGRPGAHSK